MVKNFIARGLRRIGYRIECCRYTPRHLFEHNLVRHLTFDDVICRHMYDNGEQVSFLQVGAYDGISTDPLRKYIKRGNWSGVMMEPQPVPAEKLRELYPNHDKIVVIPAAVDRTKGTRKLYTLVNNNFPKWAGSMASFDKGNIMKLKWQFPDMDSHLQCLEVPCMPFEDILQSLPIADRLDVLQIDAEGADGYLLSLFPFAALTPAIVHWEIKNLSRTEKEAAIDLMISHGYRIARSGSEDMIATRRP